MRYRKLDDNGDMVFGHGSADYLVDSSATVAQAVMTGLRLFQGEWFLDTSAGVPWLTKVAGRSGLFDLVLKQAALGTQGVVQLGNYASSLDAAARVLTVTDDGIVTAYGPGGLNFDINFGGFGAGPFSGNPFGG